MFFCTGKGSHDMFNKKKARIYVFLKEDKRSVYSWKLDLNSKEIHLTRLIQLLFLLNSRVKIWPELEVRPNHTRIVIPSSLFQIPAWRRNIVRILITLGAMGTGIALWDAYAYIGAVSGMKRSDKCSKLITGESLNTLCTTGSWCKNEYRPQKWTDIEYNQIKLCENITSL